MIVSHTGNRQPMCRELPVRVGVLIAIHTLADHHPQVPRYPSLNRVTRLISRKV
jgi:hypothetical protein